MNYPEFQLPHDFLDLLEMRRPLSLRLLANGKIVDLEAREISRSLIENWLTLHSAPCPSGYQYKLGKENYRELIAVLEAQWFDVFRSIQSCRQRSLLRLRPWPAPYTAALSLRYDVDRTVSAARIAELIHIQSQLINAPCASWYFFVGDPKRLSQSTQLRRGWQEIGLHLQKASDGIKGFGVTHHSAPSSDYWRGDRSTAELDRQNVAYGEFLATRIPRPRPAWLSDGEKGGRIGALWTVPIHFPLEGATSNRSLEYFDFLLDEFREVIALQGHAIIGSHPDVDQRPLAALLEREELSCVWFATVAQVVERCRSVLDPGAVRTVGNGTDGVIRLRAVAPLADLVVEIWDPEAVNPAIEIVQLTDHARKVAEA